MPCGSTSSRPPPEPPWPHSPTSCCAASGRSRRLRRSLLERLQVAPQVLDLVAELRGVLESQLLGGEVHLLLERDHELLELLARHPLDLRRAAPPPRGGHRRRLELKQLRDVRDALGDRLRHDPVLLVVRDLDGAAPVRLVERLLDRLRLL